MFSKQQLLPSLKFLYQVTADFNCSDCVSFISYFVGFLVLVGSVCLTSEWTYGGNSKEDGVGLNGKAHRF